MVKPTNKFRLCLLSLWILLITGSVIFYIIYYDSITPKSISNFIKQTQNYILFFYTMISMARGFVLLPNTPLVLAGTLLFPENLIIVLLISMLGIVFSSTMIYFFSEYLGFDEFFKKRYPKQVKKIKNKLEQPNGIVFVILWAFFPLVPTDAVCYVAGSVKMNVLKFLLAIFTGELILVSFYIWAGKKLLLIF